ncbi:MAG: adenosylcobinamide-GDP ribazoletransferase, partial [Pseudomonas aeruginosa]|nr:adenosylcobinamide-GDP ribazoletransferase [Pseudomonas aeruginosa]
MLFAWLRSRFLARLGGTTGDTAGALVELTECAVLVALAL